MGGTLRKLVSIPGGAADACVVGVCAYIVDHIERYVHLIGCNHTSATESNRFTLFAVYPIVKMYDYTLALLAINEDN